MKKKSYICRLKKQNNKLYIAVMIPKSVLPLQTPMVMYMVSTMADTRLQRFTHLVLTYHSNIYNKI